MHGIKAKLLSTKKSRFIQNVYIKQFNQLVIRYRIPLFKRLSRFFPVCSSLHCMFPALLYIVIAVLCIPLTVSNALRMVKMSLAHNIKIIAPLLMLASRLCARIMWLHYSVMRLWAVNAWNSTKSSEYELVFIKSIINDGDA